jgi:DNA-binding transcriptional regulator YhcF (GntR family)
LAWELVNDRPIYLQLADDIKLRIVTGIYKTGEKIPTVRDLADEANVNPNTMQRALAALEDSGLLITHRTVGRVVTDDTAIIETTKGSIADGIVKGFLDKMRTLGYDKTAVLAYVQNFN